MKTKSFSVVILHYNVPVFLEGALDSVCRAVEGTDAEIIVADNASPSFDIERFRRLFPSVRFLLFDKNHGFAKGNNLAVKEARGEYVFLLNPDVLVPENIFRDLLEKVKDLKDLGIAGVRLIDGSGNFLPEGKRRIATLRGALDRLFLKDPNRGRYYDNRLAETGDGPTDILVGAFMLFRRDRFLNLGGFDERYFMYGEDVDLSYTFLQAGYRNFYFGSLAAIHFKGESTPDNAVYRKHFTKANMRFYQKYFPFKAIMLKPLLYVGSRLLEYKKKRKERVLSQPDCLIYEGTRDELVPVLESILEVHGKGGECKKRLTVFDLKDVSLRNVIDRMWEARKGENRYRFITSSGDWVFGSDSALGFGERKLIRK